MRVMLDTNVISSDPVFGSLTIVAVEEDIAVLGHRGNINVLKPLV